MHLNLMALAMHRVQAKHKWKRQLQSLQLGKFTPLPQLLPTLVKKLCVPIVLKDLHCMGLYDITLQASDKFPEPGISQ